MKITGSVGTDEIPEGEYPNRRNMWRSLVDRAMADHRAGRATVVEVADRAEYRRMMNGTVLYWRKLFVEVDPVVVPLDGGSLKVYMQIKDREDLKPVSLGKPRGRPRKAQAQ